MDPSSNDEHIWAVLRERSLRPGGFGEDRARIWPALLGAQPLSDPPPYSEVDSMNEYGNPPKEGFEELVRGPHADERQIKLDTDRSFVLYPGESDSTPARDALQSDLHGLLVSLFRKRRSLHYFQGFHDIMTVLFLTLPRPLHLPCAEKMALHRVRDAMGVGLEPILGLLRILRNLLRLVDPAYAEVLESASPLPYHALSHLLTLFSHDVPTLPLIQHVWDFLLSREPIAVVWLAAALILHRKPSIYRLVEQDEDGMIHSLLGGIPELVDADQEHLDASDNDCVKGIVIDVDCAANDEAATGGVCRLDAGGADSHEQLRVSGTRVSHEVTVRNEDEHGQRGQSVSESTAETPILELACAIPLPESRPVSPIPSLHPSPSVHSITPLPQETHDLPPSPHHAPSHSRSSSSNSTRPPSTEPSMTNPTSHHGKSVAIKLRDKPPPLSLTYLLRQADDLLNTYPPSHPSLRITEIMGRDSAMRTWQPLPISTMAQAAVPEKLPHSETDDYLETLVNSSQIVIPSPPPSPLLSPRHSAKKMRASPRTPRKALLDPRRMSLRLGALTPAERRVLFIGALLVVGAAVALKSSKISCVDGIAKTSAGDGLKRLWNGKWTLVSSVVAAWGRGLP